MYKIERILLPLAVMLILAGGSIFYGGCGNAETPAEKDMPQAAIIDQLYQMDTTRTFPADALALLEKAGYEVTTYRDEEVTVDLYRELPAYSYDVIIFSTHAGLLYFQGDDSAEPRAGTYLYTGETYSNRRYVGEQLSGNIQNGWMSDDLPLVFAVSADFIREELKGDFDGTAIIMMGCSSYSNDDLATAFIDRGASLYTGWSATLSLEHTDNATIHFLNNIFSARKTIGEAVIDTMDQVGRDPIYGARLKYMPETAGNSDVYEITGRVK